MKCERRYCYEESIGVRKNMLGRGNEQELWSDWVSKGGKKNIRDWRSRYHESEWVKRDDSSKSERWTWYDSILGIGRFYMITFFFLSNVKRKRGSILMDSAGTEMWAPSGRDWLFHGSWASAKITGSRSAGRLNKWTDERVHVVNFFVKIFLCLLLFPFLFASQENCDANKTNFLSFMQRSSLWPFFFFLFKYLVLKKGVMSK